jgi:hypothetical protein
MVPMHRALFGNTSRAIKQVRDIAKVLLAQHLPKPRGHRGTGQARNVKIPLSLSRHVRPGVERDFSKRGLVRLYITFHVPLSSLLWDLCVCSTVACFPITTAGEALQPMFKGSWKSKAIFK